MGKPVATVNNEVFPSSMSVYIGWTNGFRDFPSEDEDTET